MPRSRRGGGGFGGSRRAPARRPAAPQRRSASTSSVPAPKPKAAPPAVPQQSSGGGLLSGIGSTIAQGMAFGTGSAIAHRAVGAVAGGLSGGGEGGEAAPVEQYGDSLNPGAPTQQLSGACAGDKQMFFECLQVNKGDQQSCSFLYDQLQTCQRNETSMSFN
eukprot:CAMPEP_0194028394 /NCGR_PEP_ID=MMETSP0009_2-20130614/2372_1 /TAXON_ID=210454 /ORGANISM="Grammatophora oceanica, Strain CCMP 410" /LENGTH=161 /DNA_ID=CAMNT_0038667775 /DNA_START=68 /DNA_END=553 /DNA_ORIENTATION=+